jgi:mitogen-activated protein kinase kinase kinase 9
MVQPLNARTFDNSMEIPFDEIKLGKQISEGGYGIIFKATWRKSTVAVKVFKIEPDNENAIRDFIS